MASSINFSATPLNLKGGCVDLSLVPSLRHNSLLRVGEFQYPIGEFQVGKKGEFYSQRSLFSEEKEGPTIFLHSLIYEMCATFEFHSRLLKVVQASPKRYILEVILEGFNGAIVDWECLAKSSNPHVYKLCTDRVGAVFESSLNGILLPWKSALKFETGIVEIVVQILSRTQYVKIDPISRSSMRNKLKVPDDRIRSVVVKAFRQVQRSFGEEHA